MSSIGGGLFAVAKWRGFRVRYGVRRFDGTGVEGMAESGGGWGEYTTVRQGARVSMGSREQRKESEEAMVMMRRRRRKTTTTGGGEYQSNGATEEGGEREGEE
jgi:hypothetical protein